MSDDTPNLVRLGESEHEVMMEVDGRTERTVTVSDDEAVDITNIATSEVEIEDDDGNVLGTTNVTGNESLSVNVSHKTENQIVFSESTPALGASSNFQVDLENIQDAFRPIQGIAFRIYWHDTDSSSPSERVNVTMESDEDAENWEGISRSGSGLRLNTGSSTTASNRDTYIEFPDNPFDMSESDDVSENHNAVVRGRDFPEDAKLINFSASDGSDRTAGATSNVYCWIEVISEVETDEFEVDFA